MGLQVQKWNQQRTDRIEEQQYLARLRFDFAAIDRDLQQCISIYRDSVDAINSVSRIIEIHTAEDVMPIADSGGFRAALVRMTAGTIPAGRSATFLEMLSTGDLSILRYAKVSDSLLAYDKRAQVNREIWGSIRD